MGLGFSSELLGKIHEAVGKSGCRYVVFRGLGLRTCFYADRQNCGGTSLYINWMEMPVLLLFLGPLGGGVRVHIGYDGLVHT